MLASKSTEAVAWKQSGGSNTLSTVAPSTCESVVESVEHDVVRPPLVKDVMYSVDRLVTVPKPEVSASSMASWTSLLSF